MSIFRTCEQCFSGFVIQNAIISHISLTFVCNLNILQIAAIFNIIAKIFFIIIHLTINNEILWRRIRIQNTLKKQAAVFDDYFVIAFTQFTNKCYVMYVMQKICCSFRNYQLLRIFVNINNHASGHICTANWF